MAVPIVRVVYGLRTNLPPTLVASAAVYGMGCLFRTRCAGAGALERHHTVSRQYGEYISTQCLPMFCTNFGAPAMKSISFVIAGRATVCPGSIGL